MQLNLRPLVTARFNVLSIDYVHVTNCFYDYDYDDYKYHFACRRKAVHLCFITSPGKMIFAVLEL